MKPLQDFISRAMLSTALRVLRAQMQQISDPLVLRRMAARADALGQPPPKVRLHAVTAGQAQALWLDVKGAQPKRVVLYLHGGAFVTETPNFHAGLLARICTQAKARGLMLSYRLAPEHRYPAALDDCIAAYLWLLEQGFEAHHIIVAGDSAGGNLTLALLLRARDEALPLPAGAVALSPVADFTFSGDSVQRNDGIDDMFSAKKIDALVPIYLATPELRTHPHVSPVFGDYTGMPPLLLIVGSTELLLDDAVRVAQRCPSAQLLVWHGMPHVFPGFAFLPEAREALQRIGQFTRLAFAQAVPTQASATAAAEATVLATPTTPAAAAPAAPRFQRSKALRYLGLAVVLTLVLLLITLALRP